MSYGTHCILNIGTANVVLNLVPSVQKCGAFFNSNSKETRAIAFILVDYLPL